MTDAPAEPASVEEALTDLQRLMRLDTAADASDLTGEVRQLVTLEGHAEQRGLKLTVEESRALRTAERSAIADLRFEHLASKTKDVVWAFASRCYLQRGVDHVPAFLSGHARELTHEICFIPIEYLEVSEEMEVFGLRLLPLDDPRIPQHNRVYNVAPPAGSVAAVETVGTSRDAMTDRARDYVDHRLRLLRIALRAHMAIVDRQLRFRASESYSYGDQASGWRDRGERGYKLELDASLIALADSQPIAQLVDGPHTDLEDKIDLALRWLERAWFTTDPLVAMLYLFFAMEAILGSSSSRNIAHGLAFRQTILAVATGEAFTNPNETFFLYSQVRNAAVHGDRPPPVDWDLVRSFAVTVRWTLDHYVTLAQERDFTTRSELLDALGRHPERQAVIRWLRHYGGPKWTDYLDRLEGKARKADCPPTAASLSRRALHRAIALAHGLLRRVHHHPVNPV